MSFPLYGKIRRIVSLRNQGTTIAVAMNWEENIRKDAAGWRKLSLQKKYQSGTHVNG